MRLAYLLTSLACTVVCGCAAPSDTDAPHARIAPEPIAASAKAGYRPGCAVVVGGSVGSQFADTKVAGFWFEANRQLSQQLYDTLVAEHYPVVNLIIPLKGQESIEQRVGQTMAQNQCKRIIQISHTVDQDAKGRYFEFDVALLHAESNGTPVATTGKPVMVGEYHHAYRYTRTQSVFEAFHPRKFAATVYADLKASGALEAWH